MTQSECEQLVETYLEGGLDQMAEEEFFIQVALDERLRSTLRSYRAIDEAFRKERQAAADSHTAVRQSVAGLLSIPEGLSIPHESGGSGNVPLAAVPDAVDGSKKKRRRAFVAFFAGALLLLCIPTTFLVLRDSGDAEEQNIPSLPMNDQVVPESAVPTTSTPTGEATGLPVTREAAPSDNAPQSLTTSSSPSTTAPQRSTLSDPNGRRKEDRAGLSAQNPAGREAASPSSQGETPHLPEAEKRTDTLVIPIEIDWQQRPPTTEQEGGE